MGVATGLALGVMLVPAGTWQDLSSAIPAPARDMLDDAGTWARAVIRGARDGVAEELVPDITGRIEPQARIEARTAPAEPMVSLPDTVKDLPGFPLPPSIADDPHAFELSVVRAALAAYATGDLAGGDVEAGRARDEATRQLLGWVAIRMAPRQVGFARIESFMRGAPDWPQQGWLRRRAEEALVAERPGDDVVRAFFAGQAPLTPGGVLILAKLRAAEGRPQDAAAMLAERWRSDTFGPDMEQRFLDAFPEAIGVSDHRRRTVLFLLEEDWAGALRNAPRAGADMPPLVKAYVAAARSAPNAKKLIDALPPTARKEPVLALAIAEGLRKQKKGPEAAKVLAGLPRNPEAIVSPEPWWNERRSLVRNLLDAGEPKLAYEVARDYPLGSASVTVDAEFHAGWLALRYLKDDKAAAAHFARAAEAATTPISIARAAYWQGRAAEAGGASGTVFYEKAARYPTSYYGQLAKTRIDARSYTVRRLLRNPDAPAAEPPAIKAVALLYEAGVPELAQALATDLAQRIDDVAVLDRLAEVAGDKGDARALLAVGKTALQRGFALDNHAFPLLGVPEVTAPGGAERPLVLAIARQESAFDPRVISSAGARGLMQLMPATAKATADRAGLAYDLDRLTGDAAYNAILGSAHLGDLVDAWRGSYLLTIASYNAGPGNVKKWIAAYGDPRSADVDAIDWVERIPFNETRNYVQRVLENLQVYRSRLGLQDMVLIDRDLKRGAGRDETAGR